MPEPKQDFISQEIRRRIASGEFTGKLPSNAELAALFDANPRTIGKTLSSLARDGAIEKRRGIGSFTRGVKGKVRLMVRGDGYALKPDSFYNEILNGVSAEASANGCEIEFRCKCQEKELDGFGGVLFLGVDENEPYALLRKRKIPFVVVERHPDPDIASVSADYHQPVYKTLRRLLDGGMSRIAYIGMTTSRMLLTDIQKFHSYLEAVDDVLHTVDFSLVRHSWPRVDFAYENFRDILRKSGPPQALFITTDLVAPGIFRAAEEFGYKIPEHIQLLSCDRLNIQLKTSLATFETPKHEIGVRSVRTLLELIASPGLKRMPKLELPIRFLPGATLPALK